MSRVSSLVMVRVAALVAFFTTFSLAEVFDFVFLHIKILRKIRQRADYTKVNCQRQHCKMFTANPIFLSVPAVSS